MVGNSSRRSLSGLSHWDWDQAVGILSCREIEQSLVEIEQSLVGQDRAVGIKRWGSRVGVGQVGKQQSAPASERRARKRIYWDS